MILIIHNLSFFHHAYHFPVYFSSPDIFESHILQQSNFLWAISDGQNGLK